MAINSNASTVYEACGFGYTLHYQLPTAGAHNLVIGPVVLDPQSRRKIDGLVCRQCNYVT